MSKHAVAAGDAAPLPGRLAELRRRAHARTGTFYPIIVIQAAGLDGFRIDRVLKKAGIARHVGDAASIAVARRRHRAETERIAGETLVRSLLADKRGEPRVCSMVVAPPPEQEDRRRPCRERKAPIAARIEPVSRIKGLLFARGVGGDEPARPAPRARGAADRRWPRLAALFESEDRPRARSARMAHRPDPNRRSGAEGLAGAGGRPGSAGDGEEAERDRPGRCGRPLAGRALPDFCPSAAGGRLCRLGRDALAGLLGMSVPRAGGGERLIQLAWLWQRHRPQSAPTHWFYERVSQGRRKGTRNRAIVALARKLLVAPWRYVSAGVMIAGAGMKTTA